jgi:hypothetical protein
MLTKENTAMLATNRQEVQFHGSDDFKVQRLKVDDGSTILAGPGLFDSGPGPLKRPRLAPLA